MKVYIETLGCDSNRTDTNRIRKYLKINEVSITDTPKDADYAVIMTCGFNQIMFDSNIKRIKEIKDNTKAKIIIGGCIPKIDPSSMTLADYSFGPRDIEKINDLFNLKTDISSVTPEFTRKQKKIIRISRGCQGSCSYCVIKRANGPTRSRSIEEIKKDIKEGLDEGYSRFVFTAEDAGSWGQDLGLSLYDLAKEIDSMEGDFSITVTTIHPKWFIKNPDMYKIYRLKKVTKNIYLPIQSASDRILGLMRREYTAGQYKEIFGKLKSDNPDIRVETDLLIGFPTETEEDFKMNMDLIRDLEIYFLQVFAYTEMDGTPASKIFPKVPFKEAERRAKEITRQFIENHKDSCTDRVLVNTNLHSLSEKKAEI